MFDKDQNTMYEFSWQKSFNWVKDREPKSRLKAMDEKTGFYLWKTDRVVQKVPTTPSPDSL